MRNRIWPVLIYGLIAASSVGAQGLGLGLGLDDARYPVVIPAWVLSGNGVVASLDYDFQNSLYYQVGAQPSDGPTNFVTTSRASTKNCDNTNGTYGSVATNTLCVTNKGALIEEARTNSIRNNSFQGAVPGVIGAGGSLGTNLVLNSATGLTVTVLGTGVQNGLDYIDIRWQGTTGSTFMVMSFESVSQVATTYGTTWTESFFVALVGGSLTNITNTKVDIRPTGGGAVIDTTFVPTATLTRVSGNGTPTNSGVTAFQPAVVFNYSSGVAIDLTLRIGWPQAENNSINSTVASATVAAGGAGGVDGAAVYQVGGGTGTAATLNVTVSGGAITAINSVAGAGSYTVFPPSPAALSYVSGVGSGVVGATVNLVPTDNAAKGFATSPIRTTAAAATRAADVVTATTSPTFGSAYTFLPKGTPNAPTGYTTAQVILDVDDGTGNNRVHLSRAASTGAFSNILVVGGVQQTAPSGGGTWSQSASAKFALAMAPADQAQSFNGGAVTTSATTPIFTPSVITIGARQGGSQQWNGYVERIALWPTTRLPNASLQSLTQ